MTLTHFQALALFALAVSGAFAFLSKKSLGARIVYTVFSFLGFLAVAICIGWLMYLFSR